jgi:hypothetical protein
MNPIKKLEVPKIKALGLNNTGGADKSQKKSLNITYKSCSKDDKFIYLYFDVYASGLSNNKAEIYVDELDPLLNDTAVPKTKITISQNSGIGIPLKFDKNKNFTEPFSDDGNVFQATITCDGLSAKSKEFKLNFNKNAVNKKTEGQTQKEYATEADWVKAAKDLGVNDPDLLRAIAQQESENIAFLVSGKPKILYERHHFYDFYKEEYGVAKADQLSLMNENIIKNANGGYGSSDFLSEKGFDNEGYYNHQFDRLDKAKKIDEDMAIKSTSFGLFQVLGGYCTYSNTTPKQFLQEMSRSEKFQIQAFVNFIKKDRAKKDLPNALNNKNWRKVALIYNGTEWETYNPKYAKNIEQYYNKKPWRKKFLD